MACSEARGGCRFPQGHPTIQPSTRIHQHAHRASTPAVHGPGGLPSRHRGVARWLLPASITDPWGGAPGSPGAGRASAPVQDSDRDTGPRPRSGSFASAADGEKSSSALMPPCLSSPSALPFANGDEGHVLQKPEHRTVCSADTIRHHPLFVRRSPRYLGPSPGAASQCQHRWVIFLQAAPTALKTLPSSVLPLGPH